MKDLNDYDSNDDQNQDDNGNDQDRINRSQSTIDKNALQVEGNLRKEL